MTINRARRRAKERATEANAPPTEAEIYAAEDVLDALRDAWELHRARALREFVADKPEAKAALAVLVRAGRSP